MAKANKNAQKKRAKVVACSLPPSKSRASIASRERRFRDSELMIALVGAVGTELSKIASILEERLKASQYNV